MKKKFTAFDDFLETAKNVPAEIEIDKVLKEIEVKAREAMAAKDTEYLKECRQRLLYWRTKLNPSRGEATIQPVADKITGIGFMVDEISTFLKDYENLKLSEPKKTGLTVKQVVLKCIYEGFTITRDNGQQIAQKYELTSGEKLYLTYTKYAVTTDRKGDPGTPRKLKEKIKLFESVVPLLTSEAAINRAVAELEILKRNLSQNK